MPHAHRFPLFMCGLHVPRAEMLLKDVLPSRHLLLTPDCPGMRRL
jgi:hypothetical protein